MGPARKMSKQTSIHAEAGLHRKLVLFAKQLNIYLNIKEY